MILSWPSEYDRDPHVIYAVDEKFRIVRCNPAWNTFALENNGSAAKASKVAGSNLFGSFRRTFPTTTMRAFSAPGSRADGSMSSTAHQPASCADCS